jgi:large subunit ribosomal protein L22
MTRATLRYDQASPTKVRQVLDLVRGLDVAEAREILRFSQRAASVEVAKLLDSAIANAEHNDHIASDELFVSAAWANEGPTAKRFRPRARGRGTRIRKRTSHITIEVSRYSDDELRERSERESAAGVGAAAERRRRLSRGRRVAASTAADHDDDHDHDHDHDHDDDLADELEDATRALAEAAGVDERHHSDGDADEAEALAEAAGVDAEEPTEATGDTDAEAADDAVADEDDTPGDPDATSSKGAK